VIKVRCSYGSRRNRKKTRAAWAQGWALRPAEVTPLTTGVSLATPLCPMSSRTPASLNAGVVLG